MSNDIFLSSVKQLTEKNLSVTELIGAAETVRRTGEPGQVAQLYNLWIQINPNDPLLHVALFNLAVTLADAGELESAKQALERAIQLNPDFYPPYINLGTVLERMGAVGESVIRWSELANRLAQVTHSNVGFRSVALKQVGRVLEMNQLAPNAEFVLKQSLETDPSQPDVIQHYIALRLQQCEWPIIAPWEGMERSTLLKGTGPLSMSIYTDDPMLQLASGWSYNKHFIGYPAIDFKEQHRAAKDRKDSERLRIGYVSSDLRHHAIGFIMAEMFELHDKNKVEVFAYYCGIPNDDPMKERIKGSVEHWVDIREMSDEAAARRILADGIDILVDINGYTKDARTKLFAMRPAPIIVNWLGYPGSMGSPYHHYIIADDWIIPEGHEIYFSEKVLRLPCYQPNDRKRDIAPAPTRQEVGLPEDALVFCSFNGAQKISRFTFERWMAILNRVPNSVLWLLEGSEAISQRLRMAAGMLGVEGSRLIFAGKKPNNEHLARYPLADLFLDNAPYGAHVTASDALWMGVPIITFPGRSFASRVTSSLVRAAGLPELVCETPEAFVERAIELGNNRGEIEKLKKKLKQNHGSCTLFDTKSLVAHLEKLYGEMWDDYRRGVLPRPDLTNLDTYLEIGIEHDHDAVEMLQVQDYEERYKAKLARRHFYCPVPQDSRFWTAAEIAKTEGTPKLAAASSGGTVREPGLKLLKKKR